jgi:arabinogalactan endo-1,4-beta-galactosidase
MASCKKSSSTVTNPVIPPDTTRTFYSWSTFVMGADLSFANQVQDYGGIYKDSGAVVDPYLIFKNHGCNVVRVRLWNNPQWTAPLNNGHLYSDLNDAEKSIKRAKDQGMAVNLDLHYSDTWADPSHQSIPAAWSGLSLAVLKDSVYNYTLFVLILKTKTSRPK